MCYIELNFSACLSYDLIQIVLHPRNASARLLVGKSLTYYSSSESIVAFSCLLTTYLFWNWFIWWFAFIWWPKQAFLVLWIWEIKSLHQLDRRSDSSFDCFGTDLARIAFLTFDLRYLEKIAMLVRSFTGFDSSRPGPSCEYSRKDMGSTKTSFLKDSFWHYLLMIFMHYSSCFTSWSSSFVYMIAIIGTE